MTTTTITNFRRNVFDLISNVIRYNDPVHITTKEGGAVVLSEDEYNGLMATVELMSVPGLPERIRAAADAPDEDYVDAEDIGW